jgi:hypothetical protein
MKKECDSELIRYGAWIWILFSGITLLSASAGYCENSNPQTPELFIKIHQPQFELKTTYSAKDDLLIEVKGKVCGKEVQGWKERFRPVPALEEKGECIHYIAKAFKQGNGYVLVKDYSGWEETGTKEVWFFRYDLIGGCYVKKELRFRDPYHPNGGIAGCDEGGCEGDLYVSKNGALILAIGLEKAPESKPIQRIKHLKNNPPQPKEKTVFCVYSMESFEAIDRGFLTNASKIQKYGEDTDISFHGVKYELFGDWFDKSKELKKN